MISLRKSTAKFSLKSVYAKCLALVAASMIVVASVMAISAMRIIEELAHNGVVKQGEKIAPTFALDMVAPVKFGVSDRIQATVDAALVTAGADGRAMLAVDMNGAVIGASGDPAAHAAMAQLGRDTVSSGASATGAQGLLTAVPIRASADAEILGAAVVAMSDKNALASAREAEFMIGLLAAGVFVLAMGGSFFVLRHVLGRPLARVSATIGQVEKGDYDTAIPMTEKRDELGAIARDIESLVATLRAAREADDMRKAQHEAQLRVVESLGRGLDAMARGVLTGQLADAFPEEYETLRGNFNRALDSLNDAIAAVAQSAEGISGSAEEIASASKQLSKRSETQAATLEQSAAALEEISTSVASAAKNASEAEKAVGSARAKARHNDDVMQSAMKAMAKIESSSDEIGAITTVIDDIAFQTNLLALNAGVEAARAGESGKGFAVVAAEVRTLAQRSSEAANRIKTLIAGSIDEVKSGARLVEEAGTVLNDVVAEIESVSELMSGIAAGASEQASGLTQINAGVADLDRVTQQNAAMVAENTASAQHLRAEAGRLTELVRRFTVRQDAKLPAPTPRTATWQAEKTDRGDEEGLRWQTV